MKFSIKNKLAVGFGISMLVMIAIIGLNYSALRKLEKLYLETLKWSVEMEMTTDAQLIGEDMHMIIANAVSSRDVAKTNREWTAEKTKNLAKFEKLAVV